MTDLLLDSHVMLWSMAQPERLSTKARALIESAESTLHFSIASLWEISVKMSIGKLDLPEDWLSQIQLQLLAWRVNWIPISPAHCEHLASMPFHHKDPFDQMLIAQASVERLTLVSTDVIFDAYGVTRAW